MADSVCVYACRTKFVNMQDEFAGLKSRHGRGRLLESRKSKDPNAGEANILLCSASAYLAVACWPRSD